MRAAVAALMLCFVPPAGAQDIAVALTDDVVDVGANFAGAKVVLFGALIGLQNEPADALPVDIVAVLRGPKTDFNIRPMTKTGMIWTTGPAITIADAPSLLVSSSTRPLDEIAPPILLDALGISSAPEDVAALIRMRHRSAAEHVGREGATEIARAFLAAARKNERYSEDAGAVDVVKDTLFKVELNLPPGALVGAYFVDVYLFREGVLLAHDAASMTVGKVGLERAIFDFAHDYSVAYGLVCVAVSIALGWLAAAAFRRR